MTALGRSATVVLAAALLPQPRPTPRIIPGPEVVVSRGEDFAHVETMLAADPGSSRRLLASTIILPQGRGDGSTWRTRTYVSGDAGVSWKASLPPDEGSSDSVVAFTPRGTALLAFLSPPQRLSVVRSDDGGAAWHGRIDLPFTDGAMIGVDWTSGGRRGHVYLAGRRGEERTDPIVVYRSSDDGRTFEAAVAIERPIVGRVLDVMVLNDSTLIVPFSTRISREAELIQCVRSSDGGRTFSQPIEIVTRPVDTEGRYGDIAAPAFASGPHAGGERLYAVYTVTAGEPHARLVRRRSDDGGRTWSQPAPIAPSTDARATHGAASVTANRSGVVGISWLERTIGPGPTGDPECDRWSCFNEIDDLFFAASLDGDVFLPPVRIASQSSRPRSKHASRFLPGFDYMLNAAAADGAFHLLWPDARSGVFQLYASTVRVR